MGTELPTYRYDVEQSRWLPGPVGRVVRADDPTNGSADKVETPQGETKKDEPPADSDAKLAEPKALSKLYAKEQTLWRLPLPATGSWAVFFPLRPPEGAVAPPWSLASVAANAPMHRIPRRRPRRWPCPERPSSSATAANGRPA